MEASNTRSQASSRFYYGWVIVVVASFVHVLSVTGHNNGIAPFVESLLTDLNITRVQFSTFYMLGALMAGISLPIAGRLYDKLGTRKFVILTFMWLGASFVILGSLPAQNAFKTIGLFVGIWWIRLLAEGMLSIASRSSIVRWFTRNRGVISACAISVSAIGFGLYPKFMLSAINLYGWRFMWIVQGLAFLTLVPLVVGTLLYDPPHGTVEEVQDTAHGSIQTGVSYSLREAMKTHMFWIVNLASCYVAFIGAGIAVNIVALGKEHSVEAGTMMNLLALLAFSILSCNLIIGRLLDKIGVRAIVAAEVTAQICSLIGMSFVHVLSGRWAFVVFNGVVWSAYGILKGVAWIRCFGPKHLGHISAFSLGCTLVSSAIAPLMFNVIKRYTGSYTIMLWVGVLMGLSLLFAIYRSSKSGKM